MIADDAQAMVARCLVDPAYLASAAGRAEEGRAAGAANDEALLPLETIHLFRGFITAIKHNGLRKVAPLTLRLLHGHNLEVAFFAAMAPSYQQARRQGPLPLPRLFAHFEERLIRFLPQVAADARAALEAVLLHEGHVWRTATAPPEQAAGPGPRLAPGARVAHFAVDVLGLCEALSRDPLGPPPPLSRRDQFLFYLRDGPAIRAFEIDAVSAAVVGGLDGRRGLAEVCDEAAAAISFVTPELVATLIEDAAGHGMVVAGPGSGTG